MKGSAELAQQRSAVRTEAVAGVFPADASVPFWITACVRLQPPRRRNGAEITASLANSVFPAVQALIADRGAAGQAGGTPLDRDRIVRWCGLGAVTKAGWLFDYLEMIGFLTIECHYNMPGQGRAPDTFTCSVTPPASYVGPRTFDELCRALELQGSARPPAFGLFSSQAGEAR